MYRQPDHSPSVPSLIVHRLQLIQGASAPPSRLKRRFYCTSSVLQLEIRAEDRNVSLLRLGSARWFCIVRKVLRLTLRASLVLQSIWSGWSMVPRGVLAPIPRRLSTETGLGDGITLNRHPRAGTVEPSAEIFRLATRKSAISQLRWVVVLERPPLSRCCRRTFLHDQALLALRDCQTLVAATVSDLLRLRKKIARSVVVSIVGEGCYDSFFKGL